jgi:hypothetical protein
MNGPEFSRGTGEGQNSGADRFPHGVWRHAHGRARVESGSCRLSKPFREQDLLDTVTTALKQDWARRAKELTNSTLRERF